MSLRKELIKVALAHPETRDHLVPLLRQASIIQPKTITIQTTHGIQEISALVLENWAVHKSLNGSGWVVTHIPTGLRAMSAKTKQQALGALEVISREPALLSADTQAEVLRFKDILKPLADQVSGRKPVIDIEGILADAGLYRQGERYGKSGDFWGITGSSRMIAVGAREVMLNVFYVGIHRPEQLNRPDTRWTLYKSELKTRMTEETLRKWATWAKNGMTTKELREVARNEYILKGDMASANGGMKRVGSAEKVKRAFLKLALKQEAFKHIMDEGGKLGILSAYGGDAKRSKSENQKRHGQLVADLQKMGYRKFETMKGSWEGVAEKALLVPNMKPEHLFELGKKYGQDSVIYKSEKGIVGMYYPKTKKVEVAVDPKADPAYAMAKDKSEYSKTRNWSFSFDFLWGKDIPWDGHSVVSHDDVKKQLGIGKEKGESLDTKHKPGEVWKTDAGNWRAMNNDGKAESFKDKEQAAQYAH